MTTYDNNNHHISVLGQETHTKATLPLSYKPPSTFLDNLFQHKQMSHLTCPHKETAPIIHTYTMDNIKTLVTPVTHHS